MPIKIFIWFTPEAKTLGNNLLKKDLTWLLTLIIKLNLILKYFFTKKNKKITWIDYKGVDCGVRITSFGDMEEYHKWSIQYVEYPNEINKLNIGLYPQHVMNFIIINTLLINNIDIDIDIDDNSDNESECESETD